MTLLALLLAIVAFSLFGAASDAHCKHVFAALPTASDRRKMRTAGWTAIALSFPASVGAQGWVFGPVLWVGLLMLGAGIVYLSLNLMVAK